MSNDFSPCEVKVFGSTLHAVPSVHFRIAFAAEVNRICNETKTRPEAIAVELGPVGAEAVRQWMTELGIGQSHRKHLPIMLGLVKRNRYLKPSMRRRAEALQRETGKLLDQIPDEVLFSELGFSRRSSLLLSPSDSIMEAIRCGCELGIPVYGVDLEDMAEPEQKTELFQDPGSAIGRVTDYVQFNQEFTQANDEEIDPRRELTMAARLKGILERHSRVLFTCGMAHWKRVQDHLMTPSLQSAQIDMSSSDPAKLLQYQRVIVDPRIAIQFLDRSPLITKLYDRWRAHPLINKKPMPYDHPVFQPYHQHLLRKTYRRYFKGQDHGNWDRIKRQDWSASTALEHLVESHAQVNMHSQPTFYDIYTCARSMMSQNFCINLMEIFMQIPWQKPNSMGVSASLEAANSGITWGKQIVRSNDDDEDDLFQLRTNPGQSTTDSFMAHKEIEVPDVWSKKDKDAIKLISTSHYHSWIPWDNLLGALSWDAICQSKKNEYVKTSEEFSSHILEGIDMKSTLRAQARGEEKYFVTDSKHVRVSADPLDCTEGLPVVWLFDGQDDIGNCNYECYTQNLFETLRHARNHDYFERQIRQFGSSAVAVVPFGKKINDDPIVKHPQFDGHLFEMRGMAFFSPLFPTYQQFAHWFAKTRFKRTPINDFPSWYRLRSAALTEITAISKIDEDAIRWQDMLVCAAIPYAGQSLTVVTPPAFELAPFVYRMAARMGKSIRVISLRRFPQKDVQRMRKIYMVKGMFDVEADSIEYKPGIGNALGEDINLYLDRVPNQWRYF